MPETTWPWLHAHGPLIALLGLIVAVLALVLPLALARYQSFGLRDMVRDRPSHPGLIEDYSVSRSAGYYRAIDRLLGLADQIYGPAFLGRAAFDRCLQIAFFYPLLAILIAWMGWGTATIGGLSVFEQSYDFWGGMWRGAVVLLLIAGTVMFLPRWVRWWDARLDRAIETAKAVDQRAGFLSKAARWSEVGVGAGFVAGVVAGVGAGFVAGVGVDPTEISTLLLFLLILPLLNALADFASLAATRRYLTNMSRRRPGALGILHDVALDIGAAAVALGALVTAIIGLLELWQMAFPQTLAFDWRGFRDAVLAGDTGQVSVLVLMAGTTLLPTIIHAVIGLAGLWAADSPSWAKAVQELCNPPEELSIHWAEKVVRLIRRGRAWAWARAIIVVVLPCLAGLWWLWSMLTA
ncbi:hypothetical protein [Aestuariicoccus sp. MJ-SS9]|uniref:hypothetical protein n=1 Tax=Aestuariicoccus sp. MJ-SS9 TaxID=3079855 RepID=UPI0029089267|nr:hypothetical protein [Aestuariicoccus sp. MJ-SS9]MDU8912056.1 hypothetical protein [Aestuariicoccus sp. MJ-SS9]